MNYLIEYQKKLGLTPDGKVGPKTAAAMMADLEITDKLFFAHMMGQVAHESRLYTNARENLNYNEAGLLNIFRKYYATLEIVDKKEVWIPIPGLAAKHARHPEIIANYVYANRMGNGSEASGDGWMYRGIFGLQLTGRANIIPFIESIGLPPYTDPDSLLNNPRNYFLAGLFWFSKNGVDRLCKAANDDCILTVTKRVNGGTNGLDDRKVQTKAIFKVLGLA